MRSRCFVGFETHEWQNLRTFSRKGLGRQTRSIALVHTIPKSTHRLSQAGSCPSTTQSRGIVNETCCGDSPIKSRVLGHTSALIVVLESSELSVLVTIIVGVAVRMLRLTETLNQGSFVDSKTRHSSERAFDRHTSNPSQKRRNRNLKKINFLQTLSRNRS